jgi:hypothetical protein
MFTFSHETHPSFSNWRPQTFSGRRRGGRRSVASIASEAGKQRQQEAKQSTFTATFVFIVVCTSLTLK